MIRPPPRSTLTDTLLPCTARFRSCMAGPAVARVRIEFAADIVGGESEALKQEKRQKLGTMASGTTREMINVDGSPMPIVDSVQRRSKFGRCLADCRIVRLHRFNFWR